MIGSLYNRQRKINKTTMFNQMEVDYVEEHSRCRNPQQGFPQALEEYGKRTGATMPHSNVMPPPKKEQEANIIPPPRTKKQQKNIIPPGQERENKCKHHPTPRRTKKQGNHISPRNLNPRNPAFLPFSRVAEEVSWQELARAGECVICLPRTFPAG